MKKELTVLGPLLLGGVGFYGDPLSTKGGWDAENEIGKTWDRFMSHMNENPERPYSLSKPFLYEVHIYGDETEQKGYFEVFVGEEVGTSELPIGLVSKFIPEAEYLKVTLCGNEITGDWWQELDTKILPEAGRRRSGAYIIEAYDERFKGMDCLEESILDIFIPVESA